MKTEKEIKHRIDILQKRLQLVPKKSDADKIYRDMILARIDELKSIIEE